MSSKRNFWRGTSKFTLFIFRSFQEKRKNFSVGRKRRRGNARKRREVPNLPLRSRAKKILVLSRGIGNWNRESESGIGNRKEKTFEKDFSAKKKGEIEERDEGVAKRLEPNWNST